jgi:hypothetical protein
MAITLTDDGPESAQLLLPGTSSARRRRNAADGADNHDKKNPIERHQNPLHSTLLAVAAVKVIIFT